MSSASLRKNGLGLLGEYQRLLRQLLRGRPHLQGSFHQVYTRCGKANCWCAQADKGHPHVRLTWSEAGTFLTRKVPAVQREQVAKLTDNYRQFQEHRRQLRALVIQIEQRLDQYEIALTQEVRRTLAFLTSSAQLAARRRRRLQVRGSGKKPTM